MATPSIDRGGSPSGRGWPNVGVEAVVHHRLVSHAAGDEQPSGPVLLDEGTDPMEVPERLGPVRRVDLDDPAGVVGVYYLVAATG